MADELSGYYTPATTGIYAILWKNGQVYNGSTYEDPVTANWGNYDIPLTEKSTTGVYAANMPASQPAGDYEFILYLETVPGTPAPTDIRISGVGTFSWNGTSVITQYTLNSELSDIQGSGFDASTDSLEDIRDSLSGSDNLANTVPGSYPAGSAGYALGRIGSGRIDVTSLVSLNGDISIVQGDDYNATDGTALEWTASESNLWPDLTDATITFSLDDGALTTTGSVVTPTGNQKVRVELTSAQTATLTEGVYSFNVRATLSNGRKTTLITNRTCTVYDDEES